MTLAPSPNSAPAGDALAVTPRRADRIGPHAAVLALVLFALVPFVQNGMIGNADEGAVLAQSRLIERTGGWSMAGDAEVDPAGRWFALDLADRVGDDWYPYAKHPLFVEVVSTVGTDRLWLLYGVMVLGTVAAAVAAGLLARRISPHYGPWALWCCGIASPLLFDSYWLIAHTLGAAAAGFAALGALRFLSDRRSDGLVLAAVGTAAAAMLRSEGVLFGVALAIGCLLLRAAGRRRFALAPVVLGTTVAAYLGDSWWYRHIETGSDARPFHITDDQGWLIGRLEGAWNSLLRPAVINSTGAGFSLVAALALVIGAAYLRFRPAEARIARVAMWVAGSAAVVRLVFLPSPVGGLLTAFPILVVGLLFLPRSVLTNPAARLCAMVAALHVGAVLATQYSAGGAGEWGGRFFHLVLPLLAPLVVVGLDAMRRSVDADSWRSAARAGAVVTLALVVLAVQSHRGIREAPRRIVDATRSAASRADRDAATAPGSNVTTVPVVMTWPAAGRFAWQDVFNRSYFMVGSADDVPLIGARLCDAGHPRVVMATDPDHADDLDRLGAYRIISRQAVDGTGWTVAILAATC